MLNGCLEQIQKKRIPKELLKEVVCFFMQNYPNEAQSYIYFNRDTNKYFVRNIEDAEASRSRVQVSAEQSSYREKHPESVICLDIHSHGHFPSFFSSVDHNAMRNGYPIVYGVIGSRCEDWIFGYMDEDDNIITVDITEIFDFS